ncbi:hypothetical protein AB0C89_29815 [Streptomyces sp. NPDC048491]|uniref:hypothetical protein n=1 Tax=Streptomyces sp. NPDC048491 TaxID=3157207 RepID=UPI00343CA254
MTHTPRRSLAILGLTATTLGASLTTATPANAGGIGDILSPAFATNCANHHTRPHATGTTTQGTGAANSNLLGLPLGTALNQCGGADLGGAINNANVQFPVGNMVSA